MFARHVSRCGHYDLPLAFAGLSEATSLNGPADMSKVTQEDGIWGLVCGVTSRLGLAGIV